MSSPYEPMQQYGQPYGDPAAGPGTPRASTSPRDVPLPIWIGLGLGILAFVTRFSVYSSSTHNGVQTSCSYIDIFGFLAAAGLVTCVVLGWTSRAGSHVARRLAAPLMFGLSAVLLALAVVHVLRGVGTIGGLCD